MPRFARLAMTLCVTLATLTACAPQKGDPGQSIIGPTGPAGRDGTDGRDGVDGTNGADAYFEVIDPCGRQATHDEILFRMSDGRLFAYFENGGKRYLTIITPGTYQTTDGTNCVFVVDANGEVH